MTEQLLPQSWRLVRLGEIIAEAQPGFACGERDPNGVIQLRMNNKVGKKTPLTAAHFEDFFRLLPSRSDSPKSWTVTRQEIEAKHYDLKAVNPNTKPVEDTRAPEELLDLIEAKAREVSEALAALRKTR